MPLRSANKLRRYCGYPADPVFDTVTGKNGVFAGDPDNSVAGVFSGYDSAEGKYLQWRVDDQTWTAIADDGSNVDVQATGSFYSSNFYFILDGANGVYRKFEAGDGYVTLKSADDVTPVDFWVPGGFWSQAPGQYGVFGGGLFMGTDTGNNNWALWQATNVLDGGGDGWHLNHSNGWLNPIGTFTAINDNSFGVQSLAIQGGYIGQTTSLSLQPYGGQILQGTPRFSGGGANNVVAAFDGNVAGLPQSFSAFGGSFRFYVGSDYTYIGAIAGSGVQISSFPGSNDPITLAFNYDNDMSNTTHTRVMGIQVKCNAGGTAARFVGFDSAGTYDDGATAFQVNGISRWAGTMTLRASTTSAGTAPLKILAGVLMTTAEANAVEADGNKIYYTTSGGVRLAMWGYGHAYVAKTGTYTLTATDYTIDCTTGTFTVTLPTAVGAAITGREYVIKNSGAGTITVATTSSQTIDGATTKTLAAGTAIKVQSNGANWIII